MTTKSAFGQRTAFAFGHGGQRLQTWGIRKWFSESPGLTSHDDILTVITLESPALSFAWFLQTTDLALEDRESVAEGFAVVALVIAPAPPAPPMDWYVADRDPAAEAEPSPVAQLGFIEFPIVIVVTAVGPPVSTQVV